MALARQKPSIPTNLLTPELSYNGVAYKVIIQDEWVYIHRVLSEGKSDKNEENKTSFSVHVIFFGSDCEGGGRC